MKLENSERAVRALKELETIDDNLIDLQNLLEKVKDGRAGVRIHEYTDSSGLNTEYFYLNGNYDIGLNTVIMEAVIEKVKQRKEALVVEIESL